MTSLQKQRREAVCVLPGISPGAYQNSGPMLLGRCTVHACAWLNAVCHGSGLPALLCDGDWLGLLLWLLSCLALCHGQVVNMPVIGRCTVFATPFASQLQAYLTLHHAILAVVSNTKNRCIR